MTTDIELLPLPDKVEVDKHLPTGVRIYAYDADTLRTYARANMEPLIAEIAALRAEREVICAESLKYADKSGRLEAKVDRLAEALRPLAELDLTPDDFDKRPDSQPIYARNKTSITVGDVRKARAALRDHEQEVGNGCPD